MKYNRTPGESLLLLLFYRALVAVIVVA